MAKRPDAAASATTESAFIKCVGYTLNVTNNVSNGTDFDIKVEGDDENEYNLQVTGLSDRPALVQALFHRIGDLWPAYGFEFRANESREITEIH